MRRITQYFDKAFLEREGADLETVLLSLERSKSRFLEALSGVPDERLHLAPREGAWSPAQIADHLVQANGYFLEGLKAALERASHPETPVPTAPMGFLSDEGKPLAPTEEQPRDGRSRDELKADLQAGTRSLAEAGQAVERVGTLHEVAQVTHFFGPLSALELLRLCAWHLRHHAKQL